jgi:hypothetical protein
MNIGDVIFQAQRVEFLFDSVQLYAALLQASEYVYHGKQEKCGRNKCSEAGATSSTFIRSGSSVYTA